MIGKVNMEICAQEMIAAVQHYLNDEVFYASLSMRAALKVKVINVRQRDNGNFMIEFEGLPESAKVKAVTSE